MLCPDASGPYLEHLKRHLERGGAKVQMVSWFGKQTPWSVIQLIVFRLMGYRTLNLNWLPFNHLFQMRLARRLCGALGIRMVWTVHNLRPHVVLLGSEENDEEAMRYVMVWAEAGIVHCERTGEEFRLKYGTSLPLTVIPFANYIGSVRPADPAASRKKLRIPEDKVAVLMLGPNRWNKGVRTYLEVVASLPDSYLGVLVGRCGNPEIRALIGEYAAKYPGRFMVRLDDLSNEEMAEHYAATDLVFMPYEDNTSSGSMMEAISLGKAVVSSDKGNMYMLVRNGENGYISNGKEELVAMIRSIDRAKAEEMGRRSLEIAGSYSWEDAARSYSEVFEGVMREGRV